MCIMQCPWNNIDTMEVYATPNKKKSMFAGETIIEKWLSLILHIPDNEQLLSGDTTSTHLD